MEELKRRILSDAMVGEGDIIRVDMFLNHCMDMDLMERTIINIMFIPVQISKEQFFHLQLQVSELIEMGRWNSIIQMVQRHKKEDCGQCMVYII